MDSEMLLEFTDKGLFVIIFRHRGDIVLPGDLSQEFTADLFICLVFQRTRQFLYSGFEAYDPDLLFPCGDKRYDYCQA